MGIIVDKLTGNPLLIDIKEADLDANLITKINSNKNTIPAQDIAMQYFDGTRVGNQFIDKGIQGLNLDIIDNDIELTSGFPYKSAAKIKQKSTSFGLIPNPNLFWFQADGTPNEIPVVSLFQNVDYANQIFTRHIEQVVDENGVETYEPRVLDIVTYASALTGDNLTLANAYYKVAVEVTTNVRWVDGINGLDTNAGTKLLPWKTPEKVIASATAGDTVYFKSYSYVVTSLVIAKTYNWKSIGFCTISTGGTNYAMAVTANSPILNRFIFDGGATTNNGTIYALGGTITFNNCLFKNEKTQIIGEAINAAHTYSNCIFNSRIANTSIPLPLQSPTMNSCYFKNASTTNAANSSYTNCKFEQIRTTGQSSCLALSGSSSTVKGCLFNYSVNAVGTTKIASITYCKFYAKITGIVAISSSVSTAELTIKYNTFYNNDITPTPTTPFFINLENPKSFDIQNNSFHSITKNQYYPIYIVTSSAYSIPNAKINYNYILNGSYQGTIIRLNGELAFNNVFDGAEVIGNKIVGHRFLYPTDATTGIHGMMLTGGTNMIVKYNHIIGCELGIVLKNGALGEAYTSGGITYNKLEDCVQGIYVRGIKGLNVFNNTFKITTTVYAKLSLCAINVDTNTAISPNVKAENVILKNNIYDIKGTMTSGNIIFDIWAAEHGSTASYENMYGGLYSFTKGSYSETQINYATVALAQAAGFLANTAITDPLLDSSLIPASAITGTDLGVTYNTGLDVSSVWKSETIESNIVTKQQVATWQNGAYII